eukprot:777213-Rhodomonas_salina.1
MVVPDYGPRAPRRAARGLGAYLASPLSYLDPTESLPRLYLVHLACLIAPLRLRQYRPTAVPHRAHRVHTPYAMPVPHNAHYAHRAHSIRYAATELEEGAEVLREVQELLSRHRYPRLPRAFQGYLAST